MIPILRSALALLFIFITAPLGALVGFPWTWITKNADRLYAMTMLIVRTALKLAGVDVEVEGEERLERGTAYIYMCNHVSNLDPPVLITRLPSRTSVLVKKELFRIPIMGQAMRMGDLVPVDRQNREAAVNSMREAAQVLARGLNMTVFPEGTRSRDGRLLPFKKGPFHLAMETGTPVVPVTILGSERLMRKGSAVIHPGRVRLVFHNPVLPTNYVDKDDLISAVRAQIASELPPAIREADIHSPA